MACTFGRGTYMSTSQEAKTLQFGTGEPHAMTEEEKEKMMELLDYVPWATLGATPNNIPVTEQKTYCRAKLRCHANSTRMLGCQQGSVHLSAELVQTNPERMHLDKSRGWQHPIHHENCNEGSQ